MDKEGLEEPGVIYHEQPKSLLDFCLGIERQIEDGKYFTAIVLLENAKPEIKREPFYAQIALRLSGESKFHLSDSNTDGEKLYMALLGYLIEKSGDFLKEYQRPLRPFIDRKI